MTIVKYKVVYQNQLLMFFDSNILMIVFLFLVILHFLINFFDVVMTVEIFIKNTSFMT